MPAWLPRRHRSLLRCRALYTDHGAFVVINVYCPNAGSPPERARLPIKMRFLEALKRKADALVASGREVLALLHGDLCSAGSYRAVRYPHSSFMAGFGRGVEKPGKGTGLRQSSLCRC